MREPSLHEPSPSEPLPSLRDRAFVLAAVRALGPVAAAAFCARRAPSLAAAATALRDPSFRAHTEAELARARPDGLERIDPSWYTPPPPSRSPAAAALLDKAAFAHLVPMIDGATAQLNGASAPRNGAALSLRAPDEIESLLVMLGRRRVALAFVGTPRGGLAQLCARVGEPAASELLAEVRALKSATPAHDEVNAAQRALFRGGGDWQRATPAAGTDAGRALFLRAGAGWLAPLLAREGDELRRVAQRLPRPLGELLLDEAATPSADAERASVVQLMAQHFAR
jgi:hypothetical protein